MDPMNPGTKVFKYDVKVRKHNGDYVSIVI